MKKLIVLFSVIMCITACTKKEDVRTNPFFEKWDTPYQVAPFDKITVEDYREAIYKGMEEHLAEIDAIVNNTEAPTFENVIRAYDRSGALLSKAYGVFSAEASSNATEAMEALDEEVTPFLSQHGDKIMMNTALFEKIKEVKNSVDPSTLSVEEKTLLEEIYSDFIRGGVLLTGEKATRFKEVNERLAVIESEFTRNITTETGNYQLVIDNEENLKGMNADAITAAANRAKDKGMEGKWVFGLDNPSVMPFLFSNENRELREEILTAYLNRCNNDNANDNKKLVKEIVTLRKEKAQLLGYNDFTEYVLEKRMAKNKDNVYQLLDQIWTPALNKAKEERGNMQKLIGKEFQLKASDWRYYSENVKMEKYNLSAEMLRPYFKAGNVRDGIFFVCNQLYGITFVPRNDIPKANADTEVFVCLDNDGKTELGVLFIDLYARPGLKRGGAWCGTYRDASADPVTGERIIPLTYISCNFTPPIGTDPALLTPDETETFFHEFGHALHNLFKINKYNGTSDVPRDFVELPSQIMEHWAFEPQVLANYAKHYQTGEVIPQDLVEKMQAASKYGQGFATTEFIAAAYLDIDYHLIAEPKDINVIEFEATTLGNRGLIKEIPPRYRSTYFNHTFSGSYAVGYYSYTWSEVLDADAFEAFEESGDIFNREIAEKFRRNILQQGGIYPADQMYRDFRGKDPDFNALLRSRGLN